MSAHQRTWKSKKIKKYKPKQKRKSQFAVRRVQSYGVIRQKRDLNIGRKLIGFCLIIGMLGILFVAGAFLYYSRSLPSLDQIKSGTVVIAQSTKIFDRTGQHLLYTIHGEENRSLISLEEIPDYVKWATIATEDQDFYTRGLAIDFKGLARALITVVKRHDLEGPGGSTITQQLVKNLILTREKTIPRKVKEIILAFRIENALERDEILELYLNQIPYGSNAYGIEQAAQTFFAKSAHELTLAQSALLSALPKATTYYSPFGTHTDQLFARQAIILEQMLNEGYITEDEWKAAREEEIEFSTKLTNIEAPHFVMYVREILASRYGEQELEQGGLRVITTLDYELQKIAEEEIKKGAANNDALGASNAALVAIDPNTGQVLAMVGSRDYFDTDNEGNFNVALANRQPGSSFKPIVYASLFSKGYTPNTVLFDVETNFSTVEGKEYMPVDFDGKENGPVTVRKALAWSLNIPAVKALYLANIFRVIDYAAQLGYSTLDDPDRVGLSLALGGGEVKLLEHVSAFATFAAQGVRRNSSVILRVENSAEEIIEETELQEGVEVFPENVALMLTDILSDNTARTEVFGLNSYLQLGDRPVAAKTGTTNDSRDAWTVGYTPQLAAGVWVGNNNFTPMNKEVSGSKVAAPIWNAFMRRAHKNKEIIPFKEPEIPETGKAILDGNIEGIVRVKIDKASGKLATENTPEEFVEEVAFADFHSILHYIDKSNPLGPPPQDPGADPQYKNWEEAIINWAKESELAGEFRTPPSEYDDVHLPENVPELNILAPTPGTRITKDSVFVVVEATAKRRISKVEYYINSSFRESAGLSPFSRTLYFGKLPDGENVITVKAFDDVGNMVSKDIRVKLDRGISTPTSPPIEKRPSVSILSPQADALIAKDQFPFTLRLYIENPELLDRLNVYYNDTQGNPMIVGAKTDSLVQNINIEWTSAPPVGSYPLYVVAIDKNEVSYRTEIEISVK